MDSPRILTKRGEGGGVARRRLKGKEGEEEEVHSSFGVARSLSITFYLSLPLPAGERERDGETLPID